MLDIRPNDDITIDKATKVSFSKDSYKMIDNTEYKLVLFNYLSENIYKHTGIDFITYMNMCDYEIDMIKDGVVAVKELLSKSIDEIDEGNDKPKDIGYGDIEEVFDI